MSCQSRLLVTPTEGGLLVTISEQGDAPMFGVGIPSRVPITCTAALA